MSIAYCEYCDKYIDLDFDCEHFPQEDAEGNPDERCIQEQEDEETN